MLCKNRRCMRPLGDHYWGAGYCCERCFHDSVSRANGARDIDYLSDPTDPTGRRAIAETREEIDALQDAMELDERLPRIVYLYRRGFSLRAIGAACGCSHQTVANLIAKLTRKTRRILRIARK